MLEIYVHPHALKHGLSEDKILFAWGHFIRRQRRDVPRENEIVAVCSDREGQWMQIVAVDRGSYLLIIHAMMPPSKKVLRELGMVRR